MSPIPLDTPFAPSVTLREVGQYVNGHVCHVAIEPLYEFGSKRVKVTDDGRERTQEKVTLLVTGGTAMLKSGEDYRPVTVGSEVVIWLQGGRRWAWIEAKRKAGGLDVGDVVQIRYTGDEPGKGAQPKKIWTVGIRKPEEKEAERVAQAEEIYHRISARPTQLRPQQDAYEDTYEEDVDAIPF